MSGVIDPGHDDANMYGCLPCPKCKGYYRVPYTKDSNAAKVLALTTGVDVSLGVIQCDGCGFTEPITEDKG